MIGALAYTACGMIAMKLRARMEIDMMVELLVFNLIWSVASSNFINVFVGMLASEASLVWGCVWG